MHKTLLSQGASNTHKPFCLNLSLAYLLVLTDNHNLDILFGTIFAALLSLKLPNLEKYGWSVRLEHLAPWLAFTLYNLLFLISYIILRNMESRNRPSQVGVTLLTLGLSVGPLGAFQMALWAAFTYKIEAAPTPEPWALNLALFFLLLSFTLHIFKFRKTAWSYLRPRRRAIWFVLISLWFVSILDGLTTLEALSHPYAEETNMLARFFYYSFPFPMNLIYHLVVEIVGFTIGFLVISKFVIKAGFIIDMLLVVWIAVNGPLNNTLFIFTGSGFGKSNTTLVTMAITLLSFFLVCVNLYSSLKRNPEFKKLNQSSR